MPHTSINGFEVLETRGNYGCAEEISHAILRADYGDGYDQSALIGPRTGLKSWRLKFNVLAQTEDDVVSVGDSSEADYLWDFYCRKQATGEPFVIESLRNGQYYLARFTDEKLSFELFALRLFTTGVSLQQVRRRGKTVFAGWKVAGAIRHYDASSLTLANGAAVTILDELVDTFNPDIEAPGAPQNVSASDTSLTQIDVSWNAATDNVSVAGYEIELDGGTPIDVGNVLAYSHSGLAEVSTHAYRVRAYDAKGNRSAWSGEAEASTGKWIVSAGQQVQSGGQDVYTLG